MIEFMDMKKAVRRILIGLTALVAVVLVALPFVVPSAVEYFLSAKLSELGFFPKVRMRLGYCWRNGPGLDGSLKVSLLDSPWRVQADFGASCSEWSLRVKMPETEFSEADPTIAKLLERFPVKGVDSLAFSGKVAVDAEAERTFRRPVPSWKVRIPLKDVSAQAVLPGEKPEERKEISIADFSVTAGASGIADHIDVAPLFPRAAFLDYGGLALTNFHASVRATERALMINEAGAGFCGGQLNVYSLFLDPQTLNTGFTLFLDNVDAGRLLNVFKGFEGTASGRLHGKIRLFVREGGKAIRLSDAFVYSTPGETGKLQMGNPELVTDNLAMAGIDDATRANVSNALTDLDYSVLKLNLKRVSGNEATLTAHISGTATRGDQSAPVDLTVNFHGELEQLINLGLGCSDKLKKGKLK